MGKKNIASSVISRVSEKGNERQQLSRADANQLPQTDHLSRREEELKRTQEIYRSFERLIDPDDAQPWALHNRLYELLTPENCADLINSLRELGGQQEAAVVRERKDRNEGEPRYEIIAGVRRFFAVKYLREQERRDIKYWIDIRELTDEQAFLLSDQENRVRNDLSEYERARDYAKACDQIYEGNKKVMAQKLGLSEAWLGRLITLGKMPDEIVDAFGPLRIRVEHIREIKPLAWERDWTLTSAGEQILERAREIAEEQAARRKEGKAEKPPAEVKKALLLAAGLGSEGREEIVAHTSSGKVGARVKSISSYRMMIQVNRREVRSADDFKQVMETLEEKFFNRE